MCGTWNVRGKKEAVWTLGLTAVVRLWDTSRLGQTLFVYVMFEVSVRPKLLGM